MESAKLTDLLKQEGSYTLFAPIDAAFGTLTEEDIALLKSKPFFPSNMSNFCLVYYLTGDQWLFSFSGDINALRAILLYHFSNGIFINGGLEGGVTNLLKTIQGNNLQVLSVSTLIGSLSVVVFSE